MQGCVNLAVYPLENLNSEQGQALVKRTQDDLQRNGVAVLPDFLLPEALEKIVADAVKFSPAFRSDNEHNIYLDDSEGTSEAERQIRQMQQKSSKTCITYDQIPCTSLISVRRRYIHPPLRI